MYTKWLCGKTRGVRKLTTGLCSKEVVSDLQNQNISPPQSRHNCTLNIVALETPPPKPILFSVPLCSIYHECYCSVSGLAFVPTSCQDNDF